MTVSAPAVALQQLLEGLAAAGSSGPEADTADRARRVLALLDQAQVDEVTRLAALIVLCPDLAGARRADEVEKRFGRETATVVSALQRLSALAPQFSAVHASRDGQGNEALSRELLRRMLLVIAADIRVVIVHLAFRLDLLRQYAAGSEAANLPVCRETREVLVPLANRLGLGFLKWELEDLAFRFLEPEAYRALARSLDEKRQAREAFVADCADRVRQALLERGIRADVYGRPKHLASIAHKLNLKRLSLEGLHDLRALRVVVASIEECYRALDVVQGLWPARAEEFDDYVARPKPNGYQSIHCVVLADDGRSLEVQIRTREMHRFAEFGVASHWRYKEAGGTPASKGSSAASGASHEAQLRWMRQLLAWQQELRTSIDAGSDSDTANGGPAPSPLAPAPIPPSPEAGPERVYALTPQARIIELPHGATPLDFAYHLHSDLGHRCRGAKVNGVLVPLTRPLANADTVEIVLAPKHQFDAGPSRDWLGNDPVYLVSARAKAKVRQWFAAQSAEPAAKPQAAADPRARGLPERTEAGLGGLEGLERRPASPQGEILVVGVDALMTRLARCCRPIPPDEITGYVSLGKGVTVHQSGCPSLQRLSADKSERLIATSWGDWSRHADSRRYPVDIELTARDRPGLLRDVSEVYAKGKWNVLAVKTLSRRDTATMRFTVEVADATSLREILRQLAQVPGVESVRRSADFGRKALQTSSRVSR